MGIPLLSNHSQPFGPSDIAKAASSISYQVQDMQVKSERTTDSQPSFILGFKQSLQQLTDF